MQNKVKPDVKTKYGQNTFMFGDNREGKCGIDSLDSFVHLPSSLSVKFKRISCGYHHSMAIDQNRMLYSWGSNNFG